ncbi:hypothetical protein BKA61DRAFT_206887 [Leptodontidium sp. MPI-SDFR-AT-0119]|nr:hypothetical protein BKA61DRAFT_206887 [Leptodontidium sp. MPI-SDFR-AT-0119]
MKKMGFNFGVAHAFKNMLTDAGFVDVVERKFEGTMGAWPKDRRGKAIGLWHLEQLKQGVQGIVMGLCTRLWAGRQAKPRSSWLNCGNNWMICGLRQKAERK